MPAAPLLTVAPLAGGYYENYPTTAGSQYDYSLASYGQDRVGELFTFPMVITAFFSAVLGGLLAGLRDKQITKEILEEAATKGLQTDKLQLCHVKRLVQVKEQAREEAAQLLNMENLGELDWVGDRAPGKVKSKFNLNPGGKNQP